MEPTTEREEYGAGTLHQLFRRKTLDRILQDADRPEYRLKRAIGPLQLTLFGVSACIGAGIFATIGTAAAGDASRLGAGPALMVSFILTAVACGFTALCYAEFASMVPISGSAYTYSYATLGEVTAWIIGWDLIIEYAVGNIAVAISWANYFKTLLAGLGIHLPDWLSMDYRTAARIAENGGRVFQEAPQIFGIPIVFNLPAVMIVAAITLVLIWGIRESARFNMVMVCIKILVLLLFIVVGILWMKPANWTPFSPNGWAGVSAGAAVVFFAYIGFDAVSTVAEETRDPQRNLPIGIIASLLICTVFYVVISAVFTGLISYPELQKALTSEQAEPLTLALQKACPSWDWAIGIVAFGSVVAHTAVLLVFQLGQPRIFFSMSRDGLLPPAFRKVHPKYRTPYLSTIITGVAVAGFAAVASIDEMVDLTNIGTLFAFILVCAGIIVMKVKSPERVRPFRVPSGMRWSVSLYLIFAVATLLIPMALPYRVLMLAVAAYLFYTCRDHILPVLGICSCGYLIFYLPATSWLRFSAWLNFGFVIYVVYGSMKSRLTGIHEGESKAQHGVYSAKIGAFLLSLGTLMIIVTRALEIFLLHFRTNSESFSLGVRSMFSLESWLEPSVFMILPLLANIFILAPVILVRIRRARALGLESAESRSTNVAVVNTLTVAGISLLYLLLLVIHP